MRVDVVRCLTCKEKRDAKDVGKMQRKEKKRKWKTQGTMTGFSLGESPFRTCFLTLRNGSVRGEPIDRVFFAQQSRAALFAECLRPRTSSSRLTSTWRAVFGDFRVVCLLQSQVIALASRFSTSWLLSGSFFFFVFFFLVAFYFPFSSPARHAPSCGVFSLFTLSLLLLCVAFAFRDSLAPPALQSF